MTSIGPMLHLVALGTGDFVYRYSFFTVAEALEYILQTVCTQVSLVHGLLRHHEAQDRTADRGDLAVVLASRDTMIRC
jgi:hypothetical protein